MPKERWPDDPSTRAYLAERWAEPWGDRRQEVVFIGAGIDWQHLRARLDACLVQLDVASGPEALPDIPDPFPVWRRVDEAV